MKRIFYNAQLDLLGILIKRNKFVLLDTGMTIGNRAFTFAWEEIGTL